VKPAPLHFNLTDSGQGHFLLEGELTFATAVVALKKVSRLFRKAQDLSLDLAGITRTDSAGIGLLLEWIRCSRNKGATLRYVHLPEHLLAMARVNGVEDLLI
jgi:phospholipid transport system transporter-binding protein